MVTKKRIVILIKLLLLVVLSLALVTTTYSMFKTQSSLSDNAHVASFAVNTKFAEFLDGTQTEDITVETRPHKEPITYEVICQNFTSDTDVVEVAVSCQFIIETFNNIPLKYTVTAKDENDAIIGETKEACTTESVQKGEGKQDVITMPKIYFPAGEKKEVIFHVTIEWCDCKDKDADNAKYAGEVEHVAIKVNWEQID